MQGRGVCVCVWGGCESAHMCTCTLLHTWDRYDSNMPREYMRINYASALRFQAHIAHCHLDFLVYYSPARAFGWWITVLKLWLVLIFLLPGGRSGRLHFFETQGGKKWNPHICVCNFVSKKFSRIWHPCQGRFFHELVIVYSSISNWP